MKMVRAIMMLAAVMSVDTLFFFQERAAAAPPTKSGNSTTSMQSWDESLPTSSRFTPLAAFGGAAVRDNNTGLVWEQAPGIETRNWATALHYCLNKNIGGTRGWRVPSVVELASLTDPSLPAPHVPVTIFTGVQLGFSDYWTATSAASETITFPIGSGAWGVEFGNGDVDVFSKTSTLFVWCVRGGMNTDAY